MPLDNSQPKMLRQESKNLGHIPCAAAYYTMEAILKKDAIHQTTTEKLHTSEDALNQISDRILDNKHRFAGLSQYHIYIATLGSIL